MPLLWFFADGYSLVSRQLPGFATLKSELMVCVRVLRIAL